MAGSKVTKQRKHGRDKIHCAAYRNSSKAEKNKIIRLTKYLKKHPLDKQAIAAIDRCKSTIAGYKPKVTAAP